MTTTTGTQTALFSIPDQITTTGYRGKHVCQITGVSYRQLDYWTRSELISASITPADGYGSQRLYSFRDMLEVKIIHNLLSVGLSLQKIRTAIAQLHTLGVDELTGLTLFSDGTTVYYCTTTDEITDLLAGGQGVFGIAIPGLMTQLTGTVTELKTTSSVKTNANEHAA